MEYLRLGERLDQDNLKMSSIKIRLKVNILC